MNHQFHHELHDTMRRAYERSYAENVPNFSHWWSHNQNDIMAEMRNRAEKGICVVTYPLPSDWAFYLDDCRSFFLTKFSRDFDVHVHLITHGVHNKLTLRVLW
jgi:hypothetical protein